jgi:tetratricopeptide (TPR) repeat protein
MRRGARTLATIVCLAGTGPLAVRPHVAAAAEDGSAEDAALKRGRKFFKKGEKLFALGRFEEALREYERAFEEYPVPEILFNIGQCHRNLGHYDEAIFSFRKYLRLKPDAANREATEELIAELEVEKQKHAPPKGPPPDAIVPPAPPPARVATPIYKKWWFWTGVTVVVAGTATAFVLASDSGGLPSTDLGNIDFPQ